MSKMILASIFGMSSQVAIKTLFIKITNTSAPIVIGVVYRPPSGNIYEFKAIW